MKAFEKNRAYQLLNRGYKRKDLIREMPHISVKAIEIWIRDWKDNIPPPPLPEPLPPLPEPELPPLPEPEPEPEPELPLPEPELPDWASEANKNCREVVVRSREINRRLQLEILSLLTEPKLNAKSIQLLSSALKINWEMEKSAGFYHLLDANIAGERLENLGFMIVDPSDEGGGHGS